MPHTKIDHAADRLFKKVKGHQLLCSSTSLTYIGIDRLKKCFNAYDWNPERSVAKKILGNSWEGYPIHWHRE